MRSPKLRLTGVPNSFHDFQIELLEGNLYNNYFLTSDHLFIFFSIRFDIDILNFDRFCHGVAKNRFFKYELKRMIFL